MWNLLRQINCANAIASFKFFIQLHHSIASFSCSVPLLRSIASFQSRHNNCAICALSVRHSSSSISIAPLHLRCTIRFICAVSFAPLHPRYISCAKSTVPITALNSAISLSEFNCAKLTALIQLRISTALYRLRHINCAISETHRSNPTLSAPRPSTGSDGPSCVSVWLPFCRTDALSG